MNQVEFFNKIAKEWDSIIEVNEEKINLLLSKLDIKSNERILDVGTGTGVIIPFIKALNKGGYIKGVDISTGMLNIAKEKYKNLENIEFEIKDVEEEEIYEKYDKIILYSMFPHLENKTKTVKTLINKNLNKNGKLIIAHSNSREFLNVYSFRNYITDDISYCKFSRKYIFTNAHTGVNRRIFIRTSLWDVNRNYHTST